MGMMHDTPTCTRTRTVACDPKDHKDGVQERLHNAYNQARCVIVSARCQGDGEFGDGVGRQGEGDRRCRLG
jgi:hypothetical protein